MLNAEQTRSLLYWFKDIPDPGRPRGKRHRLTTVLGIVAGATLCGMRGYKAISDWARSLGPDESEEIAIDGKTICNAIDEKGRQTRIMS